MGKKLYTKENISKAETEWLGIPELVVLKTNRDDVGLEVVHRSGNVKKCAVGKYPKSEKLGSAGQAACCACAHSRYLTGGSPSGLRV